MRLALEQMKRMHFSVGRSAPVPEGFARILLRGRKETKEGAEEHARKRLEGLMTQAEDSGVPELGAFVVKVHQDAEAVPTAMVIPYSQGQTEGRINKLKLIKRSMYGHDKFDLLRQRLLYTAAS